MLKVHWLEVLVEILIAYVTDSLYKGFVCKLSVKCDKTQAEA